MASTNRLYICAVIVLSIVYECASIHCYYCNSANNSACIDIKEYSDEVRARLIPVVNCEIAIPSPVSVNFFCRKIVHKIFHSHRDTELRVTRGCGWVQDTRDCYRADNSDHMETACQCFTDYCNAADTLDPAANVAIFLLLAAVLYFYR